MRRNASFRVTRAIAATAGPSAFASYRSSTRPGNPAKGRALPIDSKWRSEHWAMLQALSGNVYYSTPRVDPGALRQLTREGEHERAREETGLTERELEILGAVSQGLSNREVGKKLFLSDQTVKFHLHNIYGKLGVANRTEAAGVAHQLGLTPGLATA